MRASGFLWRNTAGLPAPPCVIAERFQHAFGAAPDAIASAPGRVNLIGEHTDYNEGFVFPLAIDRRVYVAASRRRDELVVARSEEFDEVSDLSWRKELPPSTPRRWQDYVASVAWSLEREGRKLRGANLLVTAGVPRGAGLSSSAALEIATARALSAVNEIPWNPRDAARIAQRGENEYVGVRCGIMDQMAASAARAGCALLLDCRSLEIDYAALPAAMAIVVMDTGVRRSLAAADYNARRAACEHVVARLRSRYPDVKTLRDVTMDMLASASGDLEPEALRRARHVVRESSRPLAMKAALERGALDEVGELMNASHASLRDDYDVSSSHLDVACELARAHPACYGARMTGAGFGGCAIAAVRTEGVDDFIRSVQPQYEAHTYKKSEFFDVRADEGARLEASSV